jgi:hypothetical protein
MGTHRSEVRDSQGNATRVDVTTNFANGTSRTEVYSAYDGLFGAAAKEHIGTQVSDSRGHSTYYPDKK